MTVTLPAHITAPDRTLEQRYDALRQANDVRSRRATLKRDIRAGRKTAVGVLSDPPEFIATMKLFDLLLVVPKWGRVKVSRVLNQCRVSPSKTVGGLSLRQRGEVVGLLRELGAGR